MTRQVVMITSLAQQFTGELTQVVFLCAFDLEFTTQPKDTSFKFLPTTFTKKVIVAGDGGTQDAEVNPYHRISGCWQQAR